jgi:predicted amidohydrolase
MEADAQARTSHPENGKIRVASCQFPVSADIRANFHWIKEQLIEAKLKKADIVHFPECALSGYPGDDIQSLEDLNWDELHRKAGLVILLPPTDLYKINCR